MSHDDFAFEPVPGLPEPLPPGEKVLWRGAPDWRAIARGVFHIRLVALYFALMIGWQVVTALYDGQPFMEAAMGVLWMSALAGMGCGILVLLAWATARTTVYTLTDERLVMRIGVALPVTLNIPFSKVSAASAKFAPDGTGNVSFELTDDERISYAVLWPHARPVRMKRAEPTLRCIPDAERVAKMAARALATSASRPGSRQNVQVPVNVRPLRPAIHSSEESAAEAEAVARSA